jgi:hypothetical protein
MPISVLQQAKNDALIAAVRSENVEAVRAAIAYVPWQARDGKLPAHVRTGAAAGHRVKDVLGVEEKEQVADELAAAITGVTAVAVFTGAVEMIEAGQVGDLEVAGWLLVESVMWSLLFRFIGSRPSRPDGRAKKVLLSRGEAQRARRKIGGDLQGEPIFCLRVPAGTLACYLKGRVASPGKYFRRPGW